MEENKKMNVLVLGASGVGKSTLIKAISGKEVKIGSGESSTLNISVYESDIWPLKLIDTKGFEYNYLQQIKTINQVKKFTKKQIKKDENSNKGIDVVWYCIDGTSRKTFSYNLKLMNKAIKKWKNVPVFVVITKSYSEIDIEENKKDIREMFSKFENINLKGIIHVVAQEYEINKDIKVMPIGIEELCVNTLNNFDEAKEINKQNLYRMVLLQKRYTANAVIGLATTSAAVIGAAPLKFPDAVILTPIETTLTEAIFKIYGVKYSGELISNIVGSTAITSIAKEIIKHIPVVGQVVNAVVAGTIVFALGESIVAVSELIYKGKIDVNKANDVTEEVVKNIKNNVIFENMISYFENNKKEIETEDPKEIIKKINSKNKKKKD